MFTAVNLPAAFSTLQLSTPVLSTGQGDKDSLASFRADSSKKHLTQSAYIKILSPIERIQGTKVLCERTSGARLYDTFNHFDFWIHDEVVFTAQVHAGVEFDRPRLNVSQA